MTIIDLSKEVKQMRHWQREFFKYQSMLRGKYGPDIKAKRDEALREAKLAEARVDAMVSGLTHLQLPIPGGVEDALSFVRKEILTAQENVNALREGWERQQSSGERVHHTFPQDASAWENRQKKLEGLEEQLVCLDRLTRKLATEEETII